MVTAALNPHRTQVGGPGEEGGLGNLSYITGGGGDQCGNMHIAQMEERRLEGAFSGF